MTTTNQNPSGENDSSSGADETTEKSVSFDTHRKLLGEKKTVQEKARALEAELEKLRQEKADAEKKKLEEEGRWKELAEAKDKELEQERQKNQAILNDLNDARKKTALLKAINGQVPANFHQLLPLDQVKVGEDGRVDEASVKAAAQLFEKEYHLAIIRDGVKTPPSDPARGGGKKLTKAEWEALPVKEMKARASEVDWSV
jgi:small-conductance mechanosensitive channel